MTENKRSEDFTKVKTKELVEAGRSLIAVSSILVATCDQYASTGSLSVGAVLHAGHVVDEVIEKLGLAELAVEYNTLPF
jgi:hypothetical protein